MVAAVPARSSVAVSLSAKVPATGPLAAEPSCRTPSCMAKLPSRTFAPLRRSVPLPTFVKLLATTEPASVAMPLV